MEGVYVVVHPEVHLDDGGSADEFDVGQGLKQGCVLGSLLLNVFLTAVLCVAEKRFLVDAVVTENIFFFFFILRRMGKNKALAHHTSTYFHTRRGSIKLSCFRSPTLAGAPFGSHGEHGAGDITWCLQGAWACLQWYKTETYDRPSVRLRLEVRLLKAEVIEAEVIETLLYGCMTWIPNKPDYDTQRQVHHSHAPPMPRMAETEARRPHHLVRQRACQDSFQEHIGDTTKTEDIGLRES